MSEWRGAALFLVVGLVAAATACGTGQRSGLQSMPPSPDASDAPLQPGDAIQVSFSGDSAAGGSYTVDETGRVSLPLLGTKEVGGTPAPRLRREIIDGYEDQLRNQAIQISLLRRVQVLGAVKEPGLYHVDPTMTLGDVLAQAGGATPQGELKNVRVMRGGRDFIVDAERGEAYAVQSGDRVFVPERAWIKRNSALVVGGLLSATAIILRTW